MLRRCMRYGNGQLIKTNNKYRAKFLAFTLTNYFDKTRIYELAISDF